MEKIIKRADIYLKIDNDEICHTIDISEFVFIPDVLNNISLKLEQLFNIYNIHSVLKLESIYFREEKINAEN